MPADWTENFELTGNERENVLKRCKSILTDWDIVPPEETVLVLSFGLSEFENIGLIEFWVANNIEEGYCGKFLFLFENQSCPEHYHKLKHETFFVVKGTVRMILNSEEKILKPGDVLPMTQGIRHSFTAIGGPAYLLEASKPCQPGDNIFTDKRIGNNGII